MRRDNRLNTQITRVTETKTINENNFSSVKFEFDFNISSHCICKTKMLNKEKRGLKILIVDDEKMIRNAIKRIILKQLNLYYDNLEIDIIEALDGIEALSVIYLAKLHNVVIDFIISDENMPFISGSYFSHAFEYGIKQGFFTPIPIFIATALGNNFNLNIYSSIVRKVYSKPLDSQSILEILGYIIKN